MNTNFFAVGTTTQNAAGEYLEAYFPFPTPFFNQESFEIFLKLVGKTDKPIFISAKDQLFGKILNYLEESQETRYRTNGMIFRSSTGSTFKRYFIYIMSEDSPLTNVITAYFKLQLISHRLVLPKSLNLENIFKVLPNVAWTNQGTIDLNDLAMLQWKNRQNNTHLFIKSIDKFPWMTDYVIPSGVRIAAPGRVRLGAYLGAGTTIMQEGFVNYNAGCAGPNMIEGRISAGVWVDKNSDIGGGASIMGTLSGGGKQKITIGENCLIGANAGLGISLGDRCTVEAGLYLTYGSKVQVYGKNNEKIKVVHAHELSGMNDLLFRRNSLTGTVECLSAGNLVSLNPDLHHKQ